jgi:FAD dependent oxidoreductase
MNWACKASSGWIATPRATGVDSELCLGAWWEPRLGLVNPAKLVREERRLALARGAQVYERTPAVEIQRGAKFRLGTPGGTVTADKIVLATNAYSHLIPELKNRQASAWTYMIATEPLSDRHFAQIRWQERNGVEDARNLIHYYRITPDNRLAMGFERIRVAAFGRAHPDAVPRPEGSEDHTSLGRPVFRDAGSDAGARLSGRSAGGLQSGLRGPWRFHRAPERHYAYGPAAGAPDGKHCVPVREPAGHFVAARAVAQRGGACDTGVFARGGLGV